MIRKSGLLAVAMLLNACAGTQVTHVQPLSEAADAPYGDVLVVALFKSFDARRYLEKEIVRQLEAKGVSAVASTSRMDTRTPVTRKTFRDMTDELGSDSGLVTQLVAVDTKDKRRDAHPESTYNVQSPNY